MVLINEDILGSIEEVQFSAGWDEFTFRVTRGAAATIVAYTSPSTTGDMSTEYNVKHRASPLT